MKVTLTELQAQLLTEALDLLIPKIEDAFMQKTDLGSAGGEAERILEARKLRNMLKQ